MERDSDDQRGSVEGGSDGGEGEQVHMQLVDHLCVTGTFYSVTRRKRSRTLLSFSSRECSLVILFITLHSW